VLALVDTGVNRAIPRLWEACLEGYDFVRGAPGADDDHGHGTFIAGLVARGAEEPVVRRLVREAVELGRGAARNG
jgi:subtilisin family serine protease